MKTRASIVTACLLVASPVVAIDWPGESAVIATDLDSAVEETRVDAIHACAALAADQAVPLLRAGLMDPSDAVQIAALEVIGDTRIMALADEAEALLSARRPAVRAEAARAYGLLRPPHAVDRLTRVLVDPDEEVRLAVVEALGSLGDAAANIAITGALQDRSEDVVIAALEALGELGQPDAVYAVIEELQSPNQEVVLAAIDTLVMLQSAEAVPGLLRLTDGRPEVALRATGALGELGATGAIDVLIGLVLGPRVEGQSEVALQALTVLADPSVLAPLAHLIPAWAPALADLLVATAPQSWPWLAQAYARAGSGDSESLAVLRVWLMTGDPAAIEALRQRAELVSDPTIDPLTDYLRLSPTPVGFCAAAERASVADAAGLIAWVEDAIAAGALSCATPLIAQVTLDDDERFTLAETIAQADPLLALDVVAQVPHEHLSWEQAGRFAALVLSAGEPAARWLVPLLSQRDARVRREASYALTQLSSTWLTDEVISAVATSGNPEVLKALAAAWGSARWPAVAEAIAPLLQAARPDLVVEALWLYSDGCELPVDVETVPHREDYWVARALGAYLVRCDAEHPLVQELAGAHDPLRRSLGLRAAPAERVVEVAMDPHASTVERVTAIGALAPGAEALTDLRESGDDVVAAAAWAASVVGESRPSRELALRAYAARSPMVRAVLYAALARAGDTEAVAHALRIEGDPTVQAMLRRDVEGLDDSRWVYLVDQATGAPRVDTDVFVLFADGRVHVTRTDHEGRALLRHPVLYTLPIESAQ